MYRPKKSIDGVDSLLKVKRYLPPTRTSISQETSEMGADLGTHQRFISSGLVHASNTMRAGALNVRVTTRSRSDFRSTVVWFLVDSPSFVFTVLLLLLEFLNDVVQFVEAFGPHPAMPFEPRRLLHEAPLAESTRAHAPDLLRRHEPSLLQDADVLLHARQRHLEALGEVRDRRIRASELLEDAAARGIGDRAERGVEADT